MKTMLFIQGGGEGAHDADAKLLASLTAELGPGFEVRYPLMPDEASPEYAPWRQLILAELASIGSGAILVGHSLGASILIKTLVEHEDQQAVAGMFLIASPFWGRGGWQGDDVTLPKDASARLSDRIPLFLYHGRDDEIVPYAHLNLYRAAFPRAVGQGLPGRNHQLNDDLSEVAADIRRLA